MDSGSDSSVPLQNVPPAIQRWIQMRQGLLTQHDQAANQDNPNDSAGTMPPVSFVNGLPTPESIRAMMSTFHQGDISANAGTTVEQSRIVLQPNSHQPNMNTTHRTLSDFTETLVSPQNATRNDADVTQSTLQNHGEHASMPVAPPSVPTPEDYIRHLYHFHGARVYTCVAKPFHAIPESYRRDLCGDEPFHPCELGNAMSRHYDEPSILAQYQACATQYGAETSMYATPDFGRRDAYGQNLHRLSQHFRLSSRAPHHNIICVDADTVVHGDDTLNAPHDDVSETSDPWAHTLHTFADTIPRARLECIALHWMYIMDEAFQFLELVKHAPIDGDTSTEARNPTVKLTDAEMQTVRHMMDTIRENICVHIHNLPRLVVVATSKQLSTLSASVERFKLAENLALNRTLLQSLAFWNTPSEDDHDDDGNTMRAGGLFAPHLLRISDSSLVDAIFDPVWMQQYWMDGNAGRVSSSPSSSRVRDTLNEDPGRDTLDASCNIVHPLLRLWDDCFLGAKAYTSLQQPSDRLRWHDMRARAETMNATEIQWMCLLFQKVPVRWMQMVLAVVCDSDDWDVISQSPSIVDARNKYDIPIVQIVPNVPSIRESLDECQFKIMDRLQALSMIITNAQEMEHMMNQVDASRASVESPNTLQSSDNTDTTDFSNHVRSQEHLWKHLNLLDRLRYAGVDVHALILRTNNKDGANDAPDPLYDGDDEDTAVIAKRQSTLVSQYDASVNYDEFWKMRLVPLRERLAIGKRLSGKNSIMNLKLPSTMARIMRIYVHAIPIAATLHGAKSIDGHDHDHHKDGIADAYNPLKICHPQELRSAIVDTLAADGIFWFSSMWHDMLTPLYPDV